MASCASSESSLLSKLECLASDPNGGGGDDDIYSLFFDHLRPFSDLSSAPKASKLANRQQQQQAHVRSLAKQYLPFLNRSLKILPKVLSAPRADQSCLFQTYRLCLSCVESLSSQLSCKPYSIHLERLCLMRSLEACALYDESRKEGFAVLESLRGIDLGGRRGRGGKVSGRFLPDMEGPIEDKEFVLLVVRIVAVLVKSLALVQSKDGGDYARTVQLVEEAMPWFRLLDADAYETWHRVLVSYLGKSALVLAAEKGCFDADLVRSFTMMSLAQYVESSLNGQTFKFAGRICSLLLSEPDGRSSFIFDVISYLSESAALKGKVETDERKRELIELVSYCANKCRSTTNEFCSAFAARLESMTCKKVRMPIDFILGIYAVGLYLSDSNVKSGRSTPLGGLEDASALRLLLLNGNRLNGLSSLLGPLKSYFQIECKENSHSQIGSCKHADCHTYLSVKHGKKEPYFLLYLGALEFLCQPIAELILDESKHILAGNEVGSSTLLCAIQDALHHFCGVLHFHCRCSSTYEKEKDGFEEYSKVLLRVTLAAFALSLITKHSLQSIMNLIEQTIASQWIQHQGLKFLVTYLHNMGVVLYRNSQVREASKTLKLSCQASWRCIMLYCQISQRDHNGIGDLSDDAIVDFVNETCARSAFYLDVLHQRGSKKAEKVILETIRSWSVAQSNFSKLPGPMPLVKRWTKIQCREQKSSHAKNSSTLCELILHSGELSRGTLTTVSEQELLAYKELSSFCPSFCNRMITRITDVLLEEVDLQDNVLQKARLLIERGIAMGPRGIPSLTECIKSLSSVSYENTFGSCAALERHQLATAYCLRALCVREGDPKSKGILQDISAALNLWSGIFSSDDCSADELSKVLQEMSLSLLSSILDLLALQGCFTFHLVIEVWKIMMKVFKWKNIPLEKCLTYLWECRRLSHALCATPISNTFIKITSGYFGENSESMDYWTSCLKDSRPMIVGFQNSFLFTFAASSKGSSNPEISLQSDTRVHEVKEAVLGLVSSVPVEGRSTFIAGHLLYDMSERFISNGRLHDALLFAKESHRLRSKLFQKKFTYSVEKQFEKYSDFGEVIQKHRYIIMDLQLSKSVVADILAFESSKFNLEDCYISPWNVLQGYLESILQVGNIHELIGNGTDAETFFLWGKDISQSQDLTHFTVAFSSVLGKLYCKKRLWNLANSELGSARQVLMDWSKDCSMNISCSKCFSLLEANISLQLGNLIRSQVHRNTRINLTDKLSEAEKLFRSALDKLDQLNWKNTDTILAGESAENSKVNTGGDVYRRTSTAPDQLAAKKVLPAREQDVKIGNTKVRKAKNVAKASLKEQSIISDGNKRVTRSRCRSSIQSTASSGDAQAVPMTSFKVDQTSSLPQLDDSKNGVWCICNNMKCWQCLLTYVTESGLVSHYIDIRWELYRRRISTGLLIGIGKCTETIDGVHAAHRIFLQSVSNLVGGNAIHLSDVPVDLIGKEFSGEMLAIERAAVLCSMSRFLLKSFSEKNERNRCCDLAQVQPPQVVSWLKLAFVLCHDVPVLSQKVAKLLAIAFIFSASGDPHSSSCNTLAENYWASYFHQVSIGSHLNHQFSLQLIQKEKVQDKLDIEAFSVSDSTSIMAEIFDLPRLTPESVKDLEVYVRRFFKSLPRTTVICVSVLGGSDSSLLQELFPSSARAWMLLSRLSSEDQPIILLQPLDPILEDALDDGSLGYGKLSDRMCSEEHWHCPWGSTVIDDVIPTYKEILEGNYLSSKVFISEDTEDNRLSWWKSRKNLDLRLRKLLRKLEDLWLGPWKHLLLGGLINSSHLDTVHKRLMRDLKSKCKVDANEALVRVILGGAKSVSEAEAFAQELHSKRGCYIGSITQYDEDGQQTTSKSVRSDKLSCLASQLLYQAISELKVDEEVHREPAILVLDSEVQMLPWENLPTLRSQEIYRMPSVDSISVTIDRSRHCQEHVGKVVASFPFIDPLDAFFLLNPGGDLKRTQVGFEKWFRDHKLEGKAGSAPAMEELTRALQKHDLFIYLGHGSGTQYIPRDEIRKLESCAATLLMGCSSGALSLHGPYIPEGTPLSYLVAGSPAIIANLWEVTDMDIDRFGKAMLESWLEERSKAMGPCHQCDFVAKEFEAMDLKNNCTGKNKKRLPKKKAAPESRDSTDCCEHSTARVGSFMGRAREACMLPYLIGAAPVCYGVPTSITRKKDIP